MNITDVTKVASIIRLTDYWEYNASTAIWTYASPVLLALGTVFNLTTVLVLLKRRFGKPSTRILLIALAVADTVVLYTGLLRHWLRYAFEVDVRKLSLGSCPLHVFMVYFSLDFSTWTLMLVTLERFISVCFPLKSRGICKEKWTYVSLLSIGILLFVYNCHILFIYGIERGRCGTKPGHSAFWKGPWYWMDMIAYAGLPIIVIVVCNCSIILKVTNGHFNRNKVHPLGHSSVQSSKVTTMTVMLLAINVTFIVLTLPSCVYFIVNPRYTSYHEYAQVVFWYALTNFLAYVNNSINFLLYCVTAPRFRKELISLVYKRQRVDDDTSMTFDHRHPSTASLCPSSDSRKHTEDDKRPTKISPPGAQITHSRK